MTPLEQQPKLPGSGMRAEAYRALPVTQHRTNLEAIRAGIKFLLSPEQREESHWGARGVDCVLVTASVLSRLGELAIPYFSRAQQGNIDDSLLWLEAARTREGGWGRRWEHRCDIESTARAVLALRAYRRQVPEGALRFIRRCRRPDGGFGAHPGDDLHPRALEMTALAVRALAEKDGSAEDFLSARLQPGGDGSTNLSSRLSAFAEILDCDKTSPCLVAKVRHLMPALSGGSLLDQALLLRSLLRLRNPWAWSMIASLRATQMEDGAWPVGEQTTGCTDAGVEEEKTVSTATAISALALGECQPGLYFGSDSPQPRRLYES
jgi:hypothetical protein